MIGLSEAQIRELVEQECRSAAMPCLGVFESDRTQDTLKPKDVLQRMVVAFARAIVANNMAIEQRLNQRGIFL